MRIAGKNTNVNSGFSLVFLSVVILIMGAIMTAVIGLYNVDNIHRRTFETTNRFKVVDTAIASYLAKYGKLPCPAPLNCNTEGLSPINDSPDTLNKTLLYFNIFFLFN